MTKASAIPPVTLRTERDTYDALAWPVIPSDTRSRHAKHLRTVIAWVRGQDDFSGASRFGGSDWEAINCDPYSISIRHEAILYQYRRSWGSKYGTQVRKRYFLARWSKTSPKHVAEEEIPAARARSAVRLFPDDPAGAVEYLLGVRPKPPAQKLPDLDGFKLVRVREDEHGVEHFYSYYDGETEYRIGEVAKEVARPYHQGGYYMYLSPEMCDPDNVATQVCGEDRLAILRVAGAGKRVRYSSSGKYCASRLTPLEVVRYL